MVGKRERNHIVVRSRPLSTEFSPRSGGGKTVHPIPEDRLRHGKRLLKSYANAIEEQQEHKEQGYRLSFESTPDFDLAITSLERRGVNPVQLLSSYQTESKEKDSATEPAKITHASIFVPYSRRTYIETKLAKYVETATSDKTKNADLVDGIASIQTCHIRNLWTDSAHDFPQNNSQKYWWEVWLIDSQDSTIAAFQRFVDDNHLQTKGRYIGFAERAMVLVEATELQLENDTNLLSILAELRKPHNAVTFLERESPSEQREWIDNLLERTVAAPKDSPTVCILDNGVQQIHPLLEQSISVNDVVSANPNWNPKPKVFAQGTESHATNMAGLALYGDLETAISSSEPNMLNHRLESVRILPSYGQNEPEQYADVMMSSTHVIESSSLDESPTSHPRTYMMAVTSNDGLVNDDIGQPTSWSSVIDALSFGQSLSTQKNNAVGILSRASETRNPRLFVVSVGNIELPLQNYDSENPHNESDLEPIADPAQAWNAITVGAYADRDALPADKPEYQGYQPIVHQGDLAADSRTSVNFNAKHWPIKPDVVAAGGNATANSEGTTDYPPELSILTTRHFSAGSGFFTTVGNTSAATAQVAYIAAEIQAHYPQYRPETVRALVIHSAEWTQEMRKQFNENSEVCLRRYGMGVPSLERALFSAANAPTLIDEAVIRPFWKDPQTDNCKSREINYHKLPWPSNVLESLGNNRVRFRVTLSYFIEPNPARRGWKDRYVYPSFGLRMSLQRKTETAEQLMQRLNKKTATNASGTTVQRDSNCFLLSDSQEHEPGSIHSCIWEGPAVDLAQTNGIAVWPTVGWWRDSKLNQSNAGVHYSIVATLQTEDTDIDVDLYTPITVANKVATPVTI